MALPAAQALSKLRGFQGPGTKALEVCYASFLRAVYDESAAKLRKVGDMVPSAVSLLFQHPARSLKGQS